jgi:hypothetical protein
MDTTGLRRARAHAQGTDLPARFGSTAEVVRHMVGLQAQDGRAVALAVRARTQGLTAADSTAPVDHGTCVVTWTLRGTRHLHAVEDVRPLLTLLAGRWLRPTRRAADLGINGVAGTRAVSALRAALAGGPLTRDEVKEVLAPVGVDAHGQAAIHVIRRAALEGVLCVLPGSVERYVLLDEMVPPAGAVDADDVAADLARRHLASTGPAGPEDLAAWAGLPVQVARRAWRTLSGEVVDVGPPGRSAWVLRRHEQTARRAARTPLGCRLLGGFDALLLAYADRSVHVPEGRSRDVNVGGGMVRPVVLVDGRVVGTWRTSGPSPARTLEVRPFEDLAAHRDELEREATGVGRFLDGAPYRLVVESERAAPPAGTGTGGKTDEPPA